MAIVFGTSGPDSLDAGEGVTNGADTIYGLDGDDLIHGLGGDDTIYGGNDVDHLLGENGIDTIFGGSDNDYIYGGAGADHIDGGLGKDSAIYTDSGSGVIVSLSTGLGFGGTAQGDTLTSIERLQGSSYVDILSGDDNFNLIHGWGGNDTLKGYGGDDSLFGHFGNDRLRGGVGADTLNGGDGIDIAAYNGSAAGVDVRLSGYAAGGDAQGDELNNIENLLGSGHNDSLWGDNGVNELRGENGNDILKGWGGADTLFGGNHQDTLFGYDGGDTLYGESGSDTLFGGTGADTMVGGLGNDTFWVESAGDVVVEAAGQGSDTVKTSVDYTLAVGVSVETLQTANHNGTGAIDLTGNAGTNMLIGNAGANILDGKGGADIMSGLGGDDTYFVNNVGDDTFESAGKGGDTVRSTVGYQLTVGQEIEALTTTNNNGVDTIVLSGNGFAQTIVGNNGVNVLNGFGGDDYLQARAGNDVLTGGTGKDKFLFNTALNAATNVDIISDFSVVDDLIRLDDAVFAGIGAVGVLNADAFHIGAAAADAEDRIVYNSGTGGLFFDSNGNAAGGMTKFAQLSAGLLLTNADFAVV